MSRSMEYDYIVWMDMEVLELINDTCNYYNKQQKINLQLQINCTYIFL